MDNGSENPRRADRRTQRTRRLLKEALFALILEKGYDAVTVEDITNRADLGRTTFYLHYRDKEELLLEAIDTISEELIAQIAPDGSAWQTVPAQVGAAADLGLHTSTAPIEFVFQHAAENAQLYLIILLGQGSAAATGRVRAIISGKVAEILTASMRAGSIHPQVPVEVFAHYFAGALLGLLTWWLENDRPHAPDVMAGMFQRLYFDGGRAMLGLPL